MSYTKIPWVDREDPEFDPLTDPAITAANLSHIEDGIVQNEFDIGGLATKHLTGEALDTVRKVRAGDDQSWYGTLFFGRIATGDYKTYLIDFKTNEVLWEAGAAASSHKYHAISASHFAYMYKEGSNAIFVIRNLNTLQITFQTTTTYDATNTILYGLNNKGMLYRDYIGNRYYVDYEGNSILDVNGVSFSGTIFKLLDDDKVVTKITASPCGLDLIDLRGDIPKVSIRVPGINAGQMHINVNSSRLFIGHSTSNVVWIYDYKGIKIATVNGANYYAKVAINEQFFIGNDNFAYDMNGNKIGEISSNDGTHEAQHLSADYFIAADSGGSRIFKLDFGGKEDAGSLQGKDLYEVLYSDEVVNSAIRNYPKGQRAMGFDLEIPGQNGILELCISAASEEVYTFDENSNYTLEASRTTFSDGTALVDNTFMISSYTYYFAGKKVKGVSASIVLQNITAKQIICFNESGALVMASGVHDAIVDKAIVAVITLDDAGGIVVFANERHGIDMSATTHLMMHETHGAVLGHGLELQGLVNDGTTFTAVKAGTLWDEDIEHKIPLDITTAPFAYREGAAGWKLSAPDDKLGYNTGEVQYNKETGGVWSLDTIGPDFVIMIFFATNDGKYPIFKVVGQHLYANRGLARKALYSELMSIKEGELPTPEFLPLGAMIIRNKNLGEIEIGADNEVWIDLRTGTPIPRY